MIFTGHEESDCHWRLLYDVSSSEMKRSGSTVLEELGVCWAIKIEQFVCYLTVIKPRISHTSPRCRWRENADERDSVLGVKPVSGQTCGLLSFWLFCLV